MIVGKTTGIEVLENPALIEAQQTEDKKPTERDENLRKSVEDLLDRAAESLRKSVEDLLDRADLRQLCLTRAFLDSLIGRK